MLVPPKPHGRALTSDKNYEVNTKHFGKTLFLVIDATTALQEEDFASLENSYHLALQVNSCKTVAVDIASSLKCSLQVYGKLKTCDFR